MVFFIRRRSSEKNLLGGMYEIPSSSWEREKILSIELNKN